MVYVVYKECNVPGGPSRAPGAIYGQTVKRGRPCMAGKRDRAAYQGLPAAALASGSASRGGAGGGRPFPMASSSCLMRR